MQLAIDTSTDNAGVALTDGEMVIFELNWRSGQNHTVELMPRIAYLMEQYMIDASALDMIAVARGPGSFNGTRVGVSAAKMLAFSLGIPIVGVTTLEVAAYPFAMTKLPVIPVVSAGRSEVAAARYQMKENIWTELEAPHLTIPEALLKETASPSVFCGELTPSFVELLRRDLGEKAVIPAPALRLRRAAVLSELGRKCLTEGGPDDAATLQPVYLRKPSITQPKKKYPETHA